VVKVDKTKLGKIKYNRRHRVDGVWIVCGVKKLLNQKVFCVFVESRDAKTLEKIISDHVLEGSIVYTDLWR
jgi:transposase-like protein